MSVYSESCPDRLLRGRVVEGRALVRAELPNVEARDDPARLRFHPERREGGSKVRVGEGGGVQRPREGVLRPGRVGGQIRAEIEGRSGAARRARPQHRAGRIHERLVVDPSGRPAVGPQPHDRAGPPTQPRGEHVARKTVDALRLLAQAHRGLPLGRLAAHPGRPELDQRNNAGEVPVVRHRAAALVVNRPDHVVPAHLGDHRRASQPVADPLGLRGGPVGQEERRVVEDRRAVGVRLEQSRVGDGSATLEQHRLDLGAVQHVQVVPLAVPVHQKAVVGVVVRPERVAQADPVPHDRRPRSHRKHHLALGSLQRGVDLSRARVDEPAAGPLPLLRRLQDVELRVAQPHHHRRHAIPAWNREVERSAIAAVVPHAGAIRDLRRDAVQNQPRAVLGVREGLRRPDQVEPLDQRDDDDAHQDRRDEHHGQKLDEREGPASVSHQSPLRWRNVSVLTTRQLPSHWLKASRFSATFGPRVNPAGFHNTRTETEAPLTRRTE